MSTITLEDLALRVDRLEARAAIEELATSYAIACDEHDMARLLSLFTDDATFDSPSKFMVANGKAAIEKMFIGMLAGRGPAYHWTHDKVVKFIDGQPDKATGLVLSHAETTPNDIVSLAAMRYQDEYVRDKGVWKFGKRVINFLYYVPADQFSTGLNSAKRVSVNGVKHPADYPESLANWQAFAKEHVSR